MYVRMDVEPFHVVGLSVETSNENGEAGRDIGELWSRFYADNVARQIPDIAGPEIYVVYTDYERGYKGRYTCIIGLRVASLANAPEGLTARSFNGGSFVNITAKGLMPKAIFETWQEIWNDDDELNRAYDHDFEVYGEKAMWGDDAEVEIYLSVNA